MTTWIALFRGINVGGHRRLPMKELKAELENLGLTDVRTYIQSGNVLFRSAESDAGALSETIASAVEKSHGFRSEVLVLDLAEFRAAAEGSPFPMTDAQAKTVHLSFLAEPPAAPDLAGLDAAKSATEEWALKGRVLYLHAPDGYAHSKLAAKAQRLLGVPVTARNWRTVTKILEMSQSG